MKYIQCSKNIVADVLSRFTINGNQETTQESIYKKGTVPKTNETEDITGGISYVNLN